MSSRRLRDVPVEDLAHLPEPCGPCVFWQSAAAAPRQADAAAKEAWWQAAQLEWDAPAKALFDEGEPVAFAVYGPASHFPRTRRLGAAVSEDALLLASVWVVEDHRQRGYAKHLLQGVLREAHRHGARALEAYGRRGSGRGASCVLPESFLLAHGFAVLRDHSDYPLLRLDLRSTVRWAETVGHALEGVRSALARREPAPAPAPAQGR